MPEEEKKLRPKYSEVKTLGRDLLSSRAYINNLPILLTFISSQFPPQYLLESVLSLQSFFTPVLPELPSSSSRISDSSKKEDPEAIYQTWLRSKFDELVRLLIDVVIRAEVDEALREVVLDTLMEFVKIGNGGRFHSAIYHRLLVNIVHSATAADFILDLLTSKYFKYIDIRYFTYISLEKLSRTLEVKDITDGKTEGSDEDDESHLRESIELSIHKIHSIISHIPALEDLKDISTYEMWSGSGESEELPEVQRTDDKQLKSKKRNNNVLCAASITKKMKLKFTKAWISFLRLPLPLGVYKEVLVNLHQAVIPHLSSPIMLCDFLTRSYDIGGVVSVMALSSLFILMTQHGLEYPNFYEKLYALLVPSIFMAKHRANFFQLLDSCLKSPLLPAYLAAAFAKKLSRLALLVPPSGALIIIALIHNLLRRHPSINCLVHREDVNGAENDNSESTRTNADDANDLGTGAHILARKSAIDDFDNDESNPVKSNAFRSSLWEVDTLHHHYCPPVSRFVLSLENDLTVRTKTTEAAINDFSSGSYATIIGEEIRRRVKQVPVAFYRRDAIPKSLFSEPDFAGWTFEYGASMEKNGENGILNVSEENDHSTAKRQRVECS